MKRCRRGPKPSLPSLMSPLNLTPWASHSRQTRIDVVYLKCNMLDTLAVFVDELADLGLLLFVSPLHEGDLRLASLDHDRVHGGLVAPDILRRPDDMESENLCEEKSWRPDS